MSGIIDVSNLIKEALEKNLHLIINLAKSHPNEQELMLQTEMQHFDEAFGQMFVINWKRNHISCIG